MGTTIESKTLENAIVDVDGLIATTPSSQTPTLSSSTSKASKSIFGVAVDGTKHYDMIFGQEMIDSGSGDYKSTKFTNLTNGTTTDDNGTTVNTKVLAVQNQYRR